VFGLHYCCLKQRSVRRLPSMQGGAMRVRLE